VSEAAVAVLIIEGKTAQEDEQLSRNRCGSVRVSNLNVIKKRIIRVLIVFKNMNSRR
jgi:hypothetical protein